MERLSWIVITRALKGGRSVRGEVTREAAKVRELRVHE